MKKKDTSIITENKMGVAPVGKLLAAMSWPAIFSMTINAMYNIVDSIFVAMISEDSLTAVTFVFPIQMLIISLGVGTGIGVNSLISRRLGARRFEEANSAAEHAVRLAFINWLIFALFGFLFAEMFISAYSDIPYIVESGTTYLKIVTIFSLFLMVTVMIEKILQATGNMILPMISSLLGAVINIVLDPILIFGLLGAPEMGVAGAAIATIIGQFASMCFCLVVLFKVDKFFKIKIKGFKVDWEIIKDIYAVGLPSIIMQSIGSVMLFGLNWILSVNKTAVAVLGAYFRLQSFVFMPVFGLNQGAMPIMGFNYGARNRERLIKTFKFSFGAAFVYMSLGFLVFQIFPDKLLLIFSASQNMLHIGIPALKWISICFIPASFGIMAATLFQATGHGIFSLAASFIRQLVGILPIAWILMKTGGVQVVWMAFPLAEILGTIFAIIGMRYVWKKDIKEMQT